MAGGAALNTVLAASRISRDLDLFHDTTEALRVTWTADVRSLQQARFDVEVIRERPSYVEAVVRRGRESVLLEWTHDSAFRFFPLVEHPDFGLTLHPFDLATNKVLALVGRAEARDWIDVIECDKSVQPFGYLAWAASGKDPGLSPDFVLEQASRSSHYSREEIAALDFESEPPDPLTLSRRWLAMTAMAASLMQLLPAEHLGKCVLHRGELCREEPSGVKRALERGQITFHAGAIRGAMPQIRAC